MEAPPPPAAAAAAATAAAAAPPEVDGRPAEDAPPAHGGLLMDAAIYEPPAERLRNYQQVGRMSVESIGCP